MCIFACIAAAAAHGFGHHSFYISHPLPHVNKFVIPQTTIVSPSFTPVVRSPVGFGYPYFKSIGLGIPNTLNLPYPLAYKPTVYTPPAGFPFGHVPFVIQFVPVDGKNETTPMEKPEDDDDEKATPAPEKEEESETSKPAESGEESEDTTERAQRSSDSENKAEEAASKDAEAVSEDDK